VKGDEKGEAPPWDGTVEPLLLDQIDAAVIAVDLDTLVTHWNAHAEALYAWSRDEVLGRSIRSIGFAAPARETADRVIEQLRQGLSWEGDVELMRKDGTRFLALVRNSPLRDPSGELIGFLGVSVDVTERRRVERALRERNAELGRMRGMARLASWEWDVSTGVVMFSDTQDEPPHWLHGAFHELLATRVHPDDRERLRRAGLAAAESGHGFSIEIKALAPEGDVRYVSCFGEVMRDPSGKPVKLWGTAQDVTDQREAARALRESEQMRRRLLAQLVTVQDEERARLAGDIHDDAIQVLHAAVLRAEALSGLLTTTGQRDAARRLEESLRGAIANLRGILAGVRQPALEGGELVPALELYLEDATADWPVRHRVESRLDREPLPEVGAVLFRIVVEAIVNARKHSGASSLAVTLERRDGGIRVEVSDDGRGFAVVASGPVDTGHWGLATMTERAASAGGWLQVHSTPGTGTRVVTWVPEPAATP
jgi:PAS domain S-box-containing protein